MRISELSTISHLSIRARQAALFVLAMIFLLLDLFFIKYDHEFRRQTIFIKHPAPRTISLDMQAEYSIHNANILVKNTPMAEMIPYLQNKDRDTIAFLVSVAKKESNWGKRSPKLASGQDCYNYWGYRGHTGTETRSGYTCFSSPKEAVDVVGGRFNELIKKEGLDTPSKMAVWKCGYDCSWDNPRSVEKWVSDVDFYHRKFYE